MGEAQRLADHQAPLVTCGSEQAEVHLRLAAPSSAVLGTESAPMFCPGDKRRLVGIVFLSEAKAVASTEGPAHAGIGQLHQLIPRMGGL